jgi:hypothetical protein
VSPLVGGANAFMLGSYIRAEGVDSSRKQALLRISLWASYYVAVFTLLNLSACLYHFHIISIMGSAVVARGVD